jgi:hypothetical protein
VAIPTNKRRGRPRVDVYEAGDMVIIHIADQIYRDHLLKPEPMEPMEAIRQAVKVARARAAGIPLSGNQIIDNQIVRRIRDRLRALEYKQYVEGRQRLIWTMPNPLAKVLPLAAALMQQKRGRPRKRNLS